MTAPPPPRRALFRSAAAADRLEQAAGWLSGRAASGEIVLLGPTLEAGASLARTVSATGSGSFGWRRTTLVRAAASLAAPALAARGLSPAGALPLEALCARVVDRLRTRGELGRFAAVAGFPGLPRALARTLADLRHGKAEQALGRLAREGTARASGPGATLTAAQQETLLDLARVHDAYEAELADARLADRALVLRLAAETAADPATSHALLDRPLLLLDLPCRSELERALTAALVARSPDVLATVPAGDERTLASLAGALGEHVVLLALPGDGRTSPPSASPAHRSLRRIQEHLFADTAIAPATLGEDVTVLSAPGESRECVEVARLAQQAAAAGVPFDRMAILLRAPAPYRPHVEEALRRAGIPAHFAKGTVEPDPAGRAFLALLACAAEGLSARRFAEYLSLGQVPRATDAGEPPPPAPPAERAVAPDEEMRSPALTEAFEIAALDTDADDAVDAVAAADRSVGRPPPAVAGGALRAPRRWERLLLESAVIGGLDRWKRRLEGLAHELDGQRRELEPDDPSADRLGRDLADLDTLRRFALPLLEQLLALPRRAPWGAWLDALSALASSALRKPERVLGVLAELAPMDTVGPVELAEVRLVLGRRLASLVQPPGRPEGRLYVAPVEAARGLAFDVVFIPGLAEKIFPQKVSEDPILLDRERALLGLDTNEARVAEERLALRLAVGAARERLVLSYPRVDMDQSRPRVPSFYGLELIRAAEGTLPSFGELARRAEQGGAARIGWPAPRKPELAVDEAEYDLALLESILHRPSDETKGRARYLLTANDHLARALRSRGRRWNLTGWKKEDGLVDPSDEARAAMALHQLSARSFSPTALQNYAGCPYRFFLYAVHRLAVRAVPEAIEELDALQKGSLVHEVLYELFSELRDQGKLPLTPAGLDDARQRLDATIQRVASKYEEDLAPAIDRVFHDGIDSVTADLRELLRRLADDPGWRPAFMELSFGLTDHRDGRDPLSQDEPVTLDCGITFRGSIDLVEQDRAGALRATDYKTGKVRAKKGDVIKGGQVLQPVFYSLVLEKRFPEKRVDEGRLYYCTSAGGFEAVGIPFDAEARAAAQTVATTVGDALRDGFLPAAPAEGGCEWCDYQAVCGPYEEQRTRRKEQGRLAPLTVLRGLK